MFNEDDINNIGKDPNSIPDGVMDASEFYEDLVFLSKQLEDTDCESVQLLSFLKEAKIIT